MKTQAEGDMKRGEGESKVRNCAHLPTVDFKVDVGKEIPQTPDTVQGEVIDHESVVHSVRLLVLADSIKEDSTMRSHLRT